MMMIDNPIPFLILLSLLLSSAPVFAWTISPQSPHRLDSRSFSLLLTPASNDNNIFLDTFSGDFDNYAQVVSDRSQGLLPREGGGHEHIHCTLIPSDGNHRIAAFYFDGNPTKIFRLRYYEVLEAATAGGAGVEQEMKLYVFSPELEGLLCREANPMEWPRIVQEYEAEPKFTELPRCDVQWSRELDPIQHQYAQNVYPDRPGYHAIMTHGEAILDSTMLPGQKILIRDQLSLWEDEFWIHDRGFNPETMEFIYGNQLGVPYQLQRVTRMTVDGEREIQNTDLQWTLGEEYRTMEEYEKKMDAINGVSSQLNISDKK